MRRGVAWVTVLTSGLVACAGPQVPVAPVAPVVPPAAWRTPPAATQPIIDQWWQGFGDPALDTLVAKALADNSDIAQAVARIRAARAQERLARAALLPSIGAGIAGDRSRSVSPFGTPWLQTEGEPYGEAAWEVDLFGRLADRKTAAHDAWLASQAARDATRLAVAAATASGYITLRALDSRLEIVRETLAARAASLKLIRRHVEAGYSPKLEEAQAEADYQAAAQIIPTLEQAVARQENALSELVDEVPGPVARGATLERLAAPAIPDGLPSELLRRRPDIANAELQLAATDANLAAARKAFLPRLNLSVSGGSAMSTLLTGPISVWSVGGSALAPLFEGGALRAGAEGAAAQRDLAALAYRKTALAALREVDDALTAAQANARQVTIITAERDALAESLRLATNRYRAGYSPYLEQLDAQRGLLAAELALAQARADHLTALVALYRAMGGGWASGPPRPS